MTNSKVSIFTDAPCAMVVLDAAARIEEANEAFARAAGAPLERLRGQTLAAAGPPLAAAVEPYLEQVRRGGAPVVNVTIDTATGERASSRQLLTCWSRVAPGEEGGVVLLLAPTPAPTPPPERAAEGAAERLLDGGWIPLGALLDHIPAGVMIAEAPSGRIVYANPRASEIVGGPAPSSEEVARYADWGLQLHADGRPYRPEELPLARSLRTGEVVRSEEITFRRADGTLRTVRSSTAPIYDRGGTMIAALAVGEDVTAEKRARAEQDRVAHFRELFLGTVGHDLRNPLSTIVIAAGLIQRLTVASEPRLQRAVEQIVTSATRITRMIDQLLDLTQSRLGGGISIERRSCDLRAVCLQVIDELNIVHGEGRARLHGSARVEGDWDPDRMAQVISNLVGNALVHGDPAGKVEVSVADEGETGIVDVHNEGAPIPPELLPVLFDPFRRARGPGRVRHKGLGLGLYIAQQIVAAHGGTLAVRSAEGAGTTFQVRVPR